MQFRARCRRASHSDIAPVRSLQQRAGDTEAGDGERVGESLAQALESWRLSQGTLEISAAHFSKGAVSVEGQGNLSLDELRRLQGNITIDAANVTSIAEKFGIPASAFAIGDLLSGFLSGQRKETSSAPTKPTRISIRMENGRALLGPVPLPVVLLPLY